MATYTIDSFLKKGEIYIDPEIQHRDRQPFTMQRAKTLFDCFRGETFDLNGVARSVFIYDGKEDLPRQSYAKGSLYAQTVDELESYAAGHDGDLPDHVATIRLECGGAPIRPGILVRPTAAATLSLKNAALKRETETFFELKLDIDGRGKKTWFCLYCEGPISEDALVNWECPVCRCHDVLPIDYSTCSRCGFSASYFSCPHCSRDFDIRLFNFICSNIKDAPSQRIAEFPISCDESLKSVVETLSDDSNRKLGQVELCLPVSIRRVQLEGYRRDQDNREWFHLSLWSSEEERPAVLMSVSLPGMMYGGGSIVDRATIEYLHLYSNPILPDALCLVTDAGTKRTLEDLNVRKAIRSPRSQ
jgi:hypothetical protein